MPTVRTKNRSGQTAEVVVSDSMAATLKAKVRQDDLESVDVVSEDSPDLVDVPVDYRPRPSVVADLPDEPVVKVDQRRSSPGQVVPEATETKRGPGRPRKTEAKSDSDTKKD